MEGLSNFENAVLQKLLAGNHPLLTELRLQAEKGNVVSREYTGAGFYCHFAVPSEVHLSQCSDFELGDVSARINGLKNGAGFLLFIRDGQLRTLEDYSYEEPWPEIVSDFELSYETEPRKLKLPAV